MKLNDVVIVGTARTPIGDYMGSLKSLTTVDLGLIAVNGALKNAGVDPSLVEEVAAGCIYKNGQKGNPARQLQIKAEMPHTGWAYTVDQQCASGMKAFELIYESLALNKASVGLAVGMESMTNAPYLLLKGREGYRMGDGEIKDSMLYDGLVCAMEGSALVMMTLERANELGLKPLARVVATANFGAQPRVMGIGPAYA
ncbi:MAG: acetyl-CoA C-acetyltransferase, partial [Tissierellia bacterium]|nr:acetyl-CoA C-acetyltransferase [Tissierellia bacterium]